MATTYSSTLGFALMATGENSGTWGTTTNTNLSPLIESSICGRTTASFTSDANLTISITDGVDSTGRYYILNCTSVSSLTATRDLICPLRAGKTYLVYNATSGSQSIRVIGSSGTGITVPSGNKAFVYCDGTNFVQAIDWMGNLTLGGTLGVTGTLTGAAANFSGLLTTSAASGNASFTLKNSSLSGKDWSFLATTSSGESDLGLYYAGTGAGTKVTITNGGLVGIGMTPSNILDITQNQNAGSKVVLLNSNASGSASSAFRATNGDNNFELYCLGTGFTTTGCWQANKGLLVGSYDVIISYGAGGGSRNLLFANSTTEVARFDTTGALTVGTTTVYNAAKISTNGKIAATGSFGNTKVYSGSIAAATATTIGTVTASVDNLQSSVKLKVSACINDSNSGYCSVYEEWNIIYGSFGGSYSGGTPVNMSRSQFSINAGVAAITTTITTVLSGTTLVIKVTANSSGAVGVTNANVMAQMELVGYAYSNLIA